MTTIECDLWQVSLNVQLMVAVVDNRRQINRLVKMQLYICQFL